MVAVDMGEAPVIETARLRLRAHRYADLADCVAMWADPNVTQFIGGKPSTAQQTWSRLLSYVGHWSLMDFGYWVIEERDTGNFVGELGFADFKRDIEAAMRDSPEIGFALTPAHYGKGYATEAVQAILAWGDLNLHSRKTVCIINPQNLASLRVAAKCGYEVFEQNSFNGSPVLFLARTARGAHGD
jgi:RimJ/RimL family protein N-acetyltransferase